MSLSKSACHWFPGKKALLVAGALASFLAGPISRANPCEGQNLAQRLLTSCSESWMAIELVGRNLQQDGCDPATVRRIQNEASQSIRRATRPEGIYDYALTPLKSMVSEAYAPYYMGQLRDACKKK